MPYDSPTAGGIQLGDSPITSGDGTTRGDLRAREGSSSPGILRLYDQAGDVYYLHMGSSGVARLGQTDPSEGQDLNLSLAAQSGGLSTDGANWMTGRLMTSDLRISSRVNVLSDVDDDFDDASIDATLWTTLGSPTEAAGYLDISTSGEGVRADYRFDGDFDVRVFVEADELPRSAQGGIFFGVDYGAAAEGRPPGDSSENGRVLIHLHEGDSNSPTDVDITANYDAGVDTVVEDITGGVDMDSRVFALRIERSGNTFTTYYRVQNTEGEKSLSDNSGWTTLKSETYDPLSDVSTNQGRPYVGSFKNLDTLVNARVLAYERISGSPVPTGSGSGPALKFDSLQTLNAGETLIQFYNGTSEDSSNLIARLEVDPCRLVLGASGQSLQGRLLLSDGGANEPGLALLREDDQTIQYLWADDDCVRHHTAAPTTAVSDGNLVGPANYGGIYVDDGSTGETLSTPAGTWQKVAGFTADMAATRKVTPAHGSDNLTVTQAGKFLILAKIGFQGDATETYEFRVFRGGTAGRKAEHVVENAGDVIEVMIVEVVQLADNDTIEVQAIAGSDGAGLTIVQAQLVAMQVG